MSAFHALARPSRHRLRAGLILSLLGGVGLSACSDESLPTHVSDLEAPEAALAPAGTPTGLRAVRPESVLSSGDASLVRLTDDNGVPVDASEVTWTSGLPAVATVSSGGVVRAVAPGTVVITARRGAAVAQHHVVVVGGGAEQLWLSPRESVLFPGEREQLQVRDANGDGVAASDVDFSSSSPSVATVSSSGRITAVAGGAAVITVRRGSGVAQHGVIVAGASESDPPQDPNPDPDSGDLEISPRESVLGRGDVGRLRPVDGNGNAVDPATVTWSSGSSSVATVSSSGLVRALDPGMIVVTGRRGDAIAHSIATVVGGGSASLRIPSFESRLSAGQTSEIEVTDGSGVPVRASDLQWSTNASSVATVSSSGVVTAVAGGLAIITARRSGGVAQHAVYVDAESPTSPGGRQIRIVRGDGQGATVGTLLPARPTVRVVDGSGTGISGVTVRWSVRSGGGSTSSASSTTNSLGEASVAWTLGSTVGDQALEASATDAGSVRFSATATSGSSSGGIRITRKESVLAPGDVSLLRVVDDSGNTVDASELSWSSSAPGIATVSSTGLVTGVSGGTATIVARRGSASAEHSAVVVGGSSSTGEVSRIEVTPSTSTLDEGQSVQLQATARDASGNVVDAALTWSSDSPAVAQVSSGGRVTGVAAGSTTIRVQAGGVTGSAQVSVSQPTQSGGLSWRPPSGWESYTRRTLPASGGVVTLNDNTDYLLQNPTSNGGVITGTLTIKGGRNVVWIGGEIEINTYRQDSESVQSGVRIWRSDGTRVRGRVVHLEGLLIHGTHLADGIVINAAEAVVQLQNVHARPNRPYSNGIHADVIQSWGGVRELRVDHLTGYTSYQGFMLKADYNGPAGPMDFRNVNLSDNGSNSSRYLFWWTPDKNSTIRVQDFWVRLSSSKSLGKAIWPDRDASSASVRPTITSDGTSPYAEYRNTSQVTGRIREGRPPGGDFVDRYQVGIGYRSPGYR